MSDDLYNEQILKLAAGLVDIDRLEAPDATVTVDSPLCGSRVKVDLKYSPTEDCVTAYGQEVRACALGKSSAAIVAKHIKGTSAEEATVLRQQVEAMLKKDGDVPIGKWAELEALIPARAHKSRHASILLPFKAVEKAIAEIKANQIVP
ncbi:iron-sulfur cluster assembly scaffold protein [Curvivirga sp.]|uniref:iron-sulfur cluster assembly scaffold protein n=1 Tax=Curvivirga sp. TaxID=2856848 RepID=UPI003B5A660F